MKGDWTLAELAQQYDIHQNQITDRKTQFLERVAQVFEEPKPEPGPDLKELHAKIGQLTLEDDFFRNTLTTDFCIDAVREAIARYGTPEIFNTD